MLRLFRDGMLLEFTQIIHFIAVRLLFFIAFLKALGSIPFTYSSAGDFRGSWYSRVDFRSSASLQTISLSSGGTFCSAKFPDAGSAEYTIMSPFVSFNSANTGWCSVKRAEIRAPWLEVVSSESLIPGKRSDKILINSERNSLWSLAEFVSY